MKKNYKFVILIFYIFTNNLIAQDFSFDIFFQDAVGNKDTLTLGYGSFASDSVDIGLGEINIVSSELDSNFDVRVTNEWETRMLNSAFEGVFHLKKQIINGTCGFIGPISIDVHCKNWPVTASWDNSNFNDTCRDGSVLTSVPEGGWWDVGSPSDLYRAELKNMNEVTFSANYSGNLNENYAYINLNSDTISVFWLIFASNDFLSVGIPQRETLFGYNFYPNPTKDKIFMAEELINQINQIEVIDFGGKSYDVKLNSDYIDLSPFQYGIYFVKLRLKNDTFIYQKIIKQ